MHLLFVANFAADTGYAWDTIEAVLRCVGQQLAQDGHRVTIAYAGMTDGPSARMRGAPFGFIEFDYQRVYTRSGLADFVGLLRKHGVDALYLTDRETWSWRYARYRHAGVRRIIVHDRTSGLRSQRNPVAGMLKAALHRVPALRADCFIGVSAFVRDRLIHNNGTPRSATHLVYNGIDLEPFEKSEPGALAHVIGVSEDVPIVFCSGRAQPYKGIQIVIDAAALLRAEDCAQPVFVFCGDGPYLPELRALAQRKGLDNFHFLGRRRDVPRLLGSATIAVVPSLWAEAFGLTVVEAMAAGIPLIATRTGGIPELIEDGRTGVLVNPGSPGEIAQALTRLLAAPEQMRSLAVRAARDVHARFSLEQAAENLYSVVAAQLGKAHFPAGAHAARVADPLIAGRS